MNQQLENVLIGLMFVSWAALRVVTADDRDRWTLPQLVPAVLHLVVAVLFLLREPSLLRGDLISILCALPSFIVGGVTINLAPAPHQWPVVAQILFATGAAGAVVGMLFLGRSFAIFPAVRTIVSRGPFQLIRHPIYFCELVMIAGCCAAIDRAVYWGMLVVAVAAIVLRIIWEEKVLHKSTGYQAFCQTVKYRLIPRVW